MKLLREKIDEVGLQSLLRGVRGQVYQLAREQPDFVYMDGRDFTGCFYTKALGGKEGPGCIVGQALAREGVDMSEYDHGSAAGISIILGAFDDGEDEEGLIKWLGDIQRTQDTGFSWRQAVEGADDPIT